MNLALFAALLFLAGCGKVCVMGVGDCSALKNQNNNQQGGKLAVAFNPRSISVGGTSTLTGTGGKVPCTFKIVGTAGSVCQLDSYNANGCTAVLRGVARGPCMVDVTDDDGIVKSDTLTVIAR